MALAMPLSRLLVLQEIVDGALVGQDDVLDCGGLCRGVSGAKPVMMVISRGALATRRSC
jgi:hypothetical protein